jgi:hypothetical protein
VLAGRKREFSRSGERTVSAEAHARKRSRRSTNQLGPLKPFRYTSASEGAEMQQIYTAVVKQDADCWIGRVKEVPGVNCQQARARSFWSLCASHSRKLSTSIELRPVTLPAKVTRSFPLRYETP